MQSAPLKSHRPSTARGLGPQGTAKGTPSSRPVLVTGGTGFLGSHVVARARAAGRAVVGVGRADGDLLDLPQAERLLRGVRPRAVIHLAALVGGIGIHHSRAGELVRDNVLLGLNVLEAARLAGVQNVILAGTAAAYPASAPVPSKEEDLDQGLPAGSSRPYAMAKRTVEEAHRGYRSQYGLSGGTLVLTNLFGPGDHFGAEASHVVAALVPRFVDAADSGDSTVRVWGTGLPTRDFLYVEDGAEAVLRAVDVLDSEVPVNVGSGRETSIAELARAVALAAGFKGAIDFDTTKPDGAPRRALDVGRAEEVLGFKAETTLEDGLRRTVASYRTARDHAPPP
ncbi:MAG: NAD-dependent epimerase/dehydratase family protein [Longimicrobiales bacterium]